MRTIEFFNFTDSTGKAKSLGVYTNNQNVVSVSRLTQASTDISLLIGFMLRCENFRNHLATEIYSEESFFVILQNTNFTKELTWEELKKLGQKEDISFI